MRNLMANAFVITPVICCGALAPASDIDEHADYIETLAGPPAQVTRIIVPAEPSIGDDEDTSAEHNDYIEIDDDLETWRLRPPTRPVSPELSRVAESPEHEDYVELLAPEDERASHPTIWFDEFVPTVSDEPEDLPPPVRTLPEGFKFIEGDLVVPVDYDASRATHTTDDFWPGGVIPYIFDDNVSSANRTLMLNAMSDWEAVATLNFRPYQSGDRNFLHIQDADFNASVAIGMAGFQHDIWISSWNTYGTVMHELGHALAYYHEQSRWDRNNFIQVNYSNISQNQCSGNPCDSQFNLRALSDAEYGPYDFDSVMHYSQCAFSECNNSIPICTPSGCGCSNNLDRCRTITVPPPNEVWQTRIGQRDHLSYFDQKVMAMLYPQSNYRFLDERNTAITNAGTFADPFWYWGAAENSVPAGGTIWIVDPGVYSGASLLTKRMFIRAPLGARLSG